MDPDSARYLGFEWEGQFYQFLVLQFFLLTAPWVFTTVMGHTVRFLQSVGVSLLEYLDNLVFCHTNESKTLASTQTMLHILPRFGWLVHPTKC